MTATPHVYMSWLGSRFCVCGTFFNMQFDLEANINFLMYRWEWGWIWLSCLIFLTSESERLRRCKVEKDAERGRDCSIVFFFQSCSCRSTPQTPVLYKGFSSTGRQKTWNGAAEMGKEGFLCLFTTNGVVLACCSEETPLQRCCWTAVYAVNWGQLYQ